MLSRCASTMRRFWTVSAVTTAVPSFSLLRKSSAMEIMFSKIAFVSAAVSLLASGRSSGTGGAVVGIVASTSLIGCVISPFSRWYVMVAQGRVVTGIALGDAFRGLAR